jgi:hypothetical protein
MRRFVEIAFLVGTILMWTTVQCVAQDFKSYAGSKLDEAASREASAAAPGKQSEVYTTADSYEKVYASYKVLYKEYTMMHSGMKLPSGKDVRWAFFILDGGKDLAGSKFWIKIQRPYVGGADGKDIREITVIQTVHSK